MIPSDTRNEVVLAGGKILFIAASLYLGAATAVFSEENKPAQLPPLLKDLESSDAVKQNRARQELRTYHFKDVVRSMSEFADDPNPDIRILMVQTLGETGGFESAKSLRKLFAREKEDRVRRAIVVQLAGLLPDELDAFTFFRKVALSEPNADIRLLALTQLSLLSGSSILEKDLKKVYKKCWKKDPDQENRIFSALTLRELGDQNPELVDALFEALRSPSVEIRRRVAGVAGSIQDPRTFERVSAAARDPDSDVRSAICRSLAESKNRSAVPILISLSKDKEPLVRKGALDSLTLFAVADVPLPIFLDALADSDASVRTLAIAVLEKRGDVSAVSLLEKTAKKDPDSAVRLLPKKALAALSRSDSPTPRP